MASFCQTWCTRLWVLQELVLAQDAVFVCGDCSMSWSYVGLATETILQDSLMQGLFETSNLQNACAMWRLGLVHNRSSSSRELLSAGDGIPSLLRPLDMARSFALTDPRNKIYGLFGFPTRENTISANSIVPGYTLNASEVYTQINAPSSRRNRIWAYCSYCPRPSRHH